MSDWCLKVLCSYDQFVNNDPINRYKAMNITRWEITNQIFLNVKGPNHVKILHYLIILVLESRLSQC